MKVKKKLKNVVKSISNHKYSLRSKSKCNQLEMKNFCLRFPSICEQIFAALDYKSLANSRKVSRFWCVDIFKQRIYSVKKIQKYSEEFPQFSKEWRKVTKKMSSLTLKKLEEAVKNLKGIKSFLILVEIGNHQSKNPYQHSAIVNKEWGNKVIMEQD